MRFYIFFYFLIFLACSKKNKFENIQKYNFKFKTTREGTTVYLTRNRVPIDSVIVKKSNLLSFENYCDSIARSNSEANNKFIKKIADLEKWDNKSFEVFDIILRHQQRKMVNSMSSKWDSIINYRINIYEKIQINQGCNTMEIISLLSKTLKHENIIYYLYEDDRLEPPLAVGQGREGQNIFRKSQYLILEKDANGKVLSLKDFVISNNFHHIEE